MQRHTDRTLCFCRGATGQLSCFSLVRKRVTSSITGTGPAALLFSAIRQRELPGAAKPSHCGFSFIPPVTRGQEVTQQQVGKV